MSANGSNTELTIRPATVADAPAVAALTDEAYARYVPLMGRKPQPMTADYHQLLAEHAGWLAYQGAQLVGLIILQHEPEALLIYSVAVHPQFQKHGYGRQLLAWAEDEARRGGYNRIRLYTNAMMVENIALYTRVGYAETGREPFGSLTIVHMDKQLGS